MMNSAPRGYRRGVPTDTPQMSPGFSPYTGFLAPPSPFGGIEERRGSIVSLSASEYSVPTPTSERSPFSEASWQQVPFGGFQTQAMSGLRHALPLGTVGLPMKASTAESFCNDWTVPTSSIEVPMRMSDSMSSGANYLPSQMSSFSESDHLTPASTSSNWSFSTAPEHSDLEYGISGQQSFWQQQIPSTHAMIGQTIAPADAMVGSEEYGFADDSHDSNSYMATEPFDHASFAASPHENAPMALPPSPQEVQVKQELEASEAEEKFTRSIHVSPKGGKTVKKERRLNGVSKRRGSKSKSQLVFRRLHDGHIDVEGYEVNPLTGKREPINGPTVEWKYCDWPDCQSRFKRPEHLKRHQRIHLGVKEHECRVEGCPKVFDRRDNYWQHGTTHIRIPGKKDGRNPRLPFSEMIKYADDAKHIEFLEKAYRKACGEDFSMESDDEGAHASRKKHTIRCRL